MSLVGKHYRQDEQVRHLQELTRRDETKGAQFGFTQVQVCRVTAILRATDVTSSGVYVPRTSGLVFKSGTSPGDAAWEMVNLDLIGNRADPADTQSGFGFRLIGCFGAYNAVSPGSMTATWGFGALAMDAGGVVIVSESNPIAADSQGLAGMSDGPNATASSYVRKSPWFGTMKEYAPFISFPSAMATGSKFWLHMELWANGPVDPKRVSI